MYIYIYLIDETLIVSVCISILKTLLTSDVMTSRHTRAYLFVIFEIHRGKKKKNTMKSKSLNFFLSRARKKK